MCFFVCFRIQSRSGPTGRAGAGLENVADPVEKVLPGRQAEPARQIHQSSRGKQTTITPFLSNLIISHFSFCAALQLTQIGADGRRSQIFLALSTASEFRDHLSSFSDFYASLGTCTSTALELAADSTVVDGRVIHHVMTERVKRLPDRKSPVIGYSCCDRAEAIHYGRT